MEIVVKVEAFEGPMELLCRLIDKNEINIYDIPIFALTEQYMASLSAMRAENPMEPLSEFVVMAATLLEIKSRLLLPKKQKDDEGDPRMELAERLAQYRKFKEVAEYLRVKEDEGFRKFFRDGYDFTVPKEIVEEEGFEKIERLLSGITLSDLFEAFKTALDRAEQKIDKVRAGFSAVDKESFTVEEKITLITSLLSGGKLAFRSLFAPSATKEELITTFLALLEIIKIGKAQAEQNGIFDEIYITAA